MTDTSTIAYDELEALNNIRLDEGLTYDQLSAMVGIETSTLHRVLSRPDRKPYDRTIHKIRRFLEERKAGAGAPRRRKAVSR